MIKKISGRILNYIYIKKFEDNLLPTYKQILENSLYPKHQINMALDYCVQHGFLNAKQMAAGNFIIIGITAHGMDIVSNEKEFKKYFSIGVNFGIVNFNWSVGEK
jgi:hypothetical protein